MEQCETVIRNLQELERMMLDSGDESEGGFNIKKIKKNIQLRKSRKNRHARHI